MTSRWYRCVHRFCNWVYFARVTVLHPERLPRSGPVLYLGLHRNGAVDGFIYHALLPRVDFMISTQLRRNWLGRLFFDGIAIARNKDEGDRNINAEALDQCVDLLRSRGELFVFPEGTSSLGPKHLPFKSGAARLLLDGLAGGAGSVQVVPLGIHYECPWGFRSRIEVVVSEPVPTELPGGLTPLAQLKEMKCRIQRGLESVGINVESESYQETIQRLAAIATLGTARSYFKTLKALERTIPENIARAWQAIEPELAAKKVLCCQGVPLFPMGPTWLYALVLLVLGPLVLAGALVNVPPLLAGYWAGKKFPDHRNVISLWRILVGVPAFALWALLLGALAVGLGQSWWFGLYCLITFVALKACYRVKKLAVAVHNGLRYPQLRPRALAFRELVQQEVPVEK